MKLLLKIFGGLFLGVIGLFIIFMIFDNQKIAKKSKLVNDLVFENKEYLNKQYGNPTPLIKGYEWRLEDGTRLQRFYTDTTENKLFKVRVINGGLDPEMFYYDLDWDLPKMEWNQTFGKMTCTELYGMKYARFHKGADALEIELNNPQKNSFGKRIK